MKVVALIITYNRVHKLRYTVRRLLQQKHKPGVIWIFNNASTDETRLFLDGLNDPCIKVWHHATNIGGAGGYYEGIQLAMQEQPDWVWCVEDDIVAPRDFLFKALPLLRDYARQNTGFVFPKLIGVQNRRDVQRPQPQEVGAGNVLQRAVFAGCILNAKAITQCGLPIARYFIYFDDWEYTTRITRNGFVGRYEPSLFLWHNDEQKPMSQVHINTPDHALWKSLYGIRNELSFYKSYNPALYPRLLLKHLIWVPIQMVCYRKSKPIQSALKWAYWSLRSLWF